jgi:hypothetical protein
MCEKCAAESLSLRRTAESLQHNQQPQFKESTVPNRSTHRIDNSNPPTPLGIPEYDFEAWEAERVNNLANKQRRNHRQSEPMQGGGTEVPPRESMILNRGDKPTPLGLPEYDWDAMSASHARH